MTPGSSPDDRTSGLTGGPGVAPTEPVPADAATPADAGPAPAATTDPAARPPRLQALAGLTVRGADGRRVGRVRDVYQHDASGRLAALTVLPRQLSARSVLIPAPAIASLPAEEDTARTPADSAGVDGASAGASSTDDSAAADAAPREVVLRVDAATAKAGLRPPDTLHATPELLAEALDVLGDLAATPSAAPDGEERAQA